MEALPFPKMSVNIYKPPRRNISEDSKFRQRFTPSKHENKWGGRKDSEKDRQNKRKKKEEKKV